MALIELRGLGKTYDLGEVKVTALKGVSLDIAEGEFVALIGPSGSGQVHPHEHPRLPRPPDHRAATGSTAWKSGGMSTDALARLRNRRIGFVFQNFNLLSRTTALENVEVPLLYDPDLAAGSGGSGPRSCSTASASATGCDHQPNQLSGGQQQRVAIARALVNHPPILLCDEPTGNLDTRTSREIMAFFRELNKTEGLTVILVTHDLEVARQADRAIVLVDGEVVVDTPDIAEAAEALHQRVAADEDV